MKDHKLTPEIIRGGVEACWSWTKDPDNDSVEVDCDHCPLGLLASPENPYNGDCALLVEFDTYPACENTHVCKVDTEQLIYEIIADKIDPVYAELLRAKEMSDGDGDN